MPLLELDHVCVSSYSVSSTYTGGSQLPISLALGFLVVPNVNIDEMRTGSKFEPKRASYEIKAEIGIRLVKL